MVRFGLWDTDRPHIPPRNTVATVRVLQLYFCDIQSWKLAPVLAPPLSIMSSVRTSEGACVCWKLRPHYYTGLWPERLWLMSFILRQIIKYSHLTVASDSTKPTQVLENTSTSFYQPILTQIIQITWAEQSQMDFHWGNISIYIPSKP